MKTTNNKAGSKRTTTQYTIKELVIDGLILSIDLDADYQREKIWSTDDQKKLLDSIIQDIDIPKIYLAKIQDDKQFDYECVDGKQRLVTLINFFKPNLFKDGSKPLTITFDTREYTFEQLKKEYPKVAERIENYKLDFVVYDKSSFEDGTRGEQLIREIFQRLQLGTRLNSAERLKAHRGTIRDFVFDEMGSKALFFRNTSLSEKRFSRQFTLAQICLHSFTRKKIYDDEKTLNSFGRARLDDLEDFFDVNSKLNNDDPNLVRIRTVLKQMDTAFSADASYISSRAVAISAYLFSEGLFLTGKTDQILEFAEFYTKLLAEIKISMDSVRKYTTVENTKVLDGFQKYILQASVEPYSIRGRNMFLDEAFSYYKNKATKGKIISK